MWLWCNAIGLAGWCANMSGPRESVRVCASHTVRRFHRRQRKRQLEWMAALRTQRRLRPRRPEEDLVYLSTTERAFDAIAQGEVRDLGLDRTLVIDAMVERNLEGLG